ncbi:Chaperone protein SicA [Pandoraea morbifera]|uniref:Chaperone protein SicA n=2 Tax=Pandoraea morbifera TaxID=2508300 RepID=A0A5E4TMP2_9BURK|nr:Chaperone protein SicA [Pandoraea morbifera]
MVRQDRRQFIRMLDTSMPADTIESASTPTASECLRTLARQAFIRMVHTARDGRGRVDLPSERDLFPRSVVRLEATTIRRRAERVALRDAARSALERNAQAREAFARSQLRAIQTDTMLAEVQTVLDILSPGDPQYARADRQRHSAIEEARGAAALADARYRAVRDSGVESWVRCLSRMPDAPPTPLVARHGDGVPGKGPGRRRFSISHPPLMSANRLAGRRLTRYRVSEGGRTMTHAATQLETEDSRVTSAIWEAVLAGASLKDIHGIPNETMDGLYAHAYDFYSNGQLAQAEAFFRFLCIYDFYNPEYIVGLAAVCQLKEEYQKAIDLYAMAFAVGKNDYRPVFYAGQCQMMMRNMALAGDCFALVCESSCDADLRTKARAYLNALEAAHAARPAADDPKVRDLATAPEGAGVASDKEAA